MPAFFCGGGGGKTLAWGTHADAIKIQKSSAGRIEQIITQSDSTEWLHYIYSEEIKGHQPKYSSAYICIQR